METKLQGRVVLVTGGTGGIGQAVCRAFADEGAIVVVHCHASSDVAAGLAVELGGMAVQADLAHPGEADDVVASIVETYGRLDICIANAGCYPPDPRPFWDIDPESWTATLRANLDVAANTARSFLRHASARRSGNLVLVGSTAGKYGEAGHGDYAAAKGAITTGLLQTLKNDVAGLGTLRVNAVAPGWTLTPKKLAQGVSEAQIGRATATMALKKLARPEEIASIIVILASDEISGHVTGQVIEIAGGMEGRMIPPFAQEA